ncbi:MAG: Threonine-tRNA ligase [Parcubacteria group bacterium GW2011_GWA2_33_14]|uniref:Threonine--tRNA ligase n=1 Tax=Candidatus Staskawiczbacteria bacterium RIFCSPHIGHO2_02_FULL_33_16 TaxID=1802204 RepID=A0A1G2HYX7_9BACT|nr:MAG: Threonine-tRNA ligase [Parcubacteria group bacterium GW2011_GWA2_33_14]OGZ67400.1 MAG: threonine--tRNA ligase [Candidatus Staskawiczbacteria bacterium RIFCSPHIGHO2_02_FULL_33_16]OGZ71035.1 MAG: threonine--tRNA ligase [Candidatus Staskawiczbacteria bacterium RIFCSPLOWO2_01_FULL_33_13]
MEENIQKIRHSLAHLLAATVKDLWPGAKNAIGPAIENGFYQDFDMGKVKISEENFEKIEKRMMEILKTWHAFEVKKISVVKAKKDFKDNPYKLELIKDFAKQGKTITENDPGNFLDLCKGGHSQNPQKDLQHFKLLSVAGAYWRGNEKNKMLTRIYGTAFESQKELDNHLYQLKEAKKRDHRILGEKLDLFTISEKVGKGLPLFTPKGALLREILNNYSQELRQAKGWQKVWSPHITKNDLYKISGHWDKFGDELFLVKSQETKDELVMKPMNCPHHQQIYAAKPHSYKDLPIKYMETTTVYRDEKAGELLGLSRVRCITQDDSHTFCTIDQIEQIYQELIDVTKIFYGKVGMKLRARLSFRDKKDVKKYLGETNLWKKAEDILLNIAKKNNLDYFVAEGEAAFYGPKIDFMATDALNREWQLATPQLDFVQPKRFGLTYTDPQGKEQTPVMIHFALMGSIERFLSVYIEHTAGNFPLWLSPVQISIIPISEKHHEYAVKVKNELEKNNIRIELKKENETLGKKIREAEMQKMPYLLIVGEKEIQANAVSVRERGKGDLGQMPIDNFIAKIKEEIKEKKT